MSKHGKFEKQPEKKSKGKKILLTVITVLLVLVVGVGIAGTVVYNSFLNKIPRAEVVDNSLSD